MYGVDLRGLTRQTLPQLKLDRLMRNGSDGNGRAQVEPSVFLAGTVWAAQSVGQGVRDHVVPEIVGVLACRHGRSEPTCSDSQFIASNADEGGRQQNRRVEVFVRPPAG